MHFKTNHVATVLSVKIFSEIKGARLIMDTQENKNVTLTLEDRRYFIFSPFKNGLYYFDANTIVTNAKPKIELENYSFLKTGSDNKKLFSTQEIKGVDTSRKLQEYLCFSGANAFKGCTNQNLRMNCEMTSDDVNRGGIIYSPLEACIKGHMLRHSLLTHNKIKKILCLS